MKTYIRVVACATIAAVGGGALAQSGSGYDLRWNVTAVGGGAMSGAGYTLTGTVGQADATSGCATGIGNYALRGGFWAGVPETDVIFRSGFQTTQC